MIDDDPIRAVLQTVIDAGDETGWSCSHYVVCVGLERITSDGGVESAAWWVAQPHQPGYVSDGLVARVADMRACAEELEA